MHRSIYYIAYIVLTIAAFYGVRLFCYHYDYYEAPATILALLGMTFLLGFTVLKAKMSNRIVVGAILGVFITLVGLASNSALVAFVLYTGEILESRIDLPGVIFFGFAIASCELAIFLKERRVFL